MTMVIHTSEVLSIRVVRSLMINYIRFMKLGGFVVRDKQKKKKTKVGLTSKGRLQVEGFLRNCPLICYSVRHVQ